MSHEWSNWSGSLRFRPDKIEAPKDDNALRSLVQEAAHKGRTVRVVGAGHSSSPLVQTDDLLISLKSFQGIESYSLTNGEAVIGTGMTVHDAGRALRKIGLATHNVGDVDVQTLVGAIGTGTHGTGYQLQNLSTMLIGMRMVNARGEIVEYSFEDDPGFLRAARVSLGTLGIFTAIRLRLLPAFQLRRREWCTHIEETLAHLDELMAENRNTVTISLHHNAGLPFQEYFSDIEPIFRAYGGRPHWGKKHTLKETDLRQLYPKWDDFQTVRKRMDPDCIFLNEYLRQLFGETRSNKMTTNNKRGGM